MQKVLRVLRYLRNHKLNAALNVLFNILSVIFNMFSLTMVAPFLNLLFMTGEEDYVKNIEGGVPDLQLSATAIIDTFNYYLSSLIVNEGKMNALIFICIMALVLIFMKNLFRYLAMFFLSPVRNGVVRDLRNDIYNKSLKLPLSYYSDERKGDIMSRITTDVQEVEWSIMSSLEMMFRDPISILLILGTLLFMSLKLTIFVFVLLPIPGFVISRIAKSLKRSSLKAKTKLGTLFSIMEETLSGLRIIKAFNAEEHSDQKFKKEDEAYTKDMVKVYRKTDLASPLSEFLGVVILVVLIYTGGKLVLDEELEAASFITFILFFSQILPPVKALTTAWYKVQRGVASIERIEMILDADEVIKEDPDAVKAPSFSKQIEYNNVSYAYRNNDTLVLKKINLTVKKGQNIALVGQSGSGKTTMADMIPRFFDPVEGSIAIDDVPLKTIRIKELRSLLGIVSQESILFNDTVYNNIAFGLNNIDKEKVIAAAKIANAHDFIMKMEKGYDTNIGDSGSKLSGGQRQRISIARAVLKNPPILILDEATSALDTESEKLVQDALDKLMENRTSIVIAHRLSTIKNADRIIVLNEGEIIEQGKHEELIKLNGTYKKLYEMQSFV